MTLTLNGGQHFESDSAREKLQLVEELRSLPDGQSPRYGNGGETWSVAFCKQSNYFAWTCGFGEISLMTLQTSKHAERNGENSELNMCSRLPIIIETGDVVWSLAFGTSKKRGDRKSEIIARRRFYNFSSLNDTVLAAGLSNGRIKIFSVSTGKLITELIDHTQLVRDLKFAPDGSLILLSASRDSTLKLWDLGDDGNMFKTLTEHSANDWVMCCAWSSDSKWIASGNSGKQVFVWSTNNWMIHRKLTGHLHTVSMCEFSVDGSFLATSSYDTTVILWDYISGNAITVFRHMLPAPTLIFASGANDHYVRSVCFSPDGAHFATVCDDGFARIWSIYDNSQPRCKTEIPYGVCASYSADGFRLAVGTRAGNVRLFAASMEVQSLSVLCRLAIRRRITAEQVDVLPLPKPVKNFLLYNETFRRQ